MFHNRIQNNQQQTEPELGVGFSFFYDELTLPLIKKDKIIKTAAKIK